MSDLSLTKNYADTELLYKADIDDMLTELEAKTNGMIDSDNVASGWATLGQLTIDKDLTLTMGTTDSSSVELDSVTLDFTFSNTYSTGNTIFKVASAEVARIDGTSNNLEIQDDVYFKDRNTTYSLFRLLGTYRKPVLVYIDGDSIDMENNTETANQSLVVFPSGPVAVTEDTAAAHKYRRLETGATANGYGSTHTGAADSGLRVDVTLAANTWYFIYAVRVRYGDNAGNNFIMVMDTTEPISSNETTLDSRYGSGEWVYLGTVRRGFGDTATTTLVSWQQDHQGWTYFVDRGTADDFFGIRVASETISSTTYSNLFTIAAGTDGESIPSIFSALKLDIRAIADGDSDIGANFEFRTAAGNSLHNLPSIGNEQIADGAQGFIIKVPNTVGAALGAKRLSTSGDDYTVKLFVSGFLDHYV